MAGALQQHLHRFIQVNGVNDGVIAYYSAHHVTVSARFPAIQGFAIYLDNIALYYTDMWPHEGIDGDVNGDSEVNVTDVNAIIDVILAVKDVETGQAGSRTDVNGDGEVNIADVNAIIDIILD